MLLYVMERKLFQSEIMFGENGDLWIDIYKYLYNQLWKDVIYFRK